MNGENQEQMYIIVASCYKCKGEINVAVVKCDVQKSGGFYGPEQFSKQEKKMAENHNVLIENHFSGTRQEYYDANTCTHCNAFIGQHYLFTDYFVEAMNDGYKYKAV